MNNDVASVGDRSPQPPPGGSSARGALARDGSVGAGVALLSQPIDLAALAAALTRADVFEIVDAGIVDAAGMGGDAPAGERGFRLSLTTAAAFATPLAPLICDALIARGVLAPDGRSTVELCLHEAVANAIVHGNLGISSAAKDLPDGHRVFGQLIRDRLDDPVTAARRTEIRVSWGPKGVDIAVQDQGEGFDASKLTGDVNGNARSGRGFVFMNALADAVAVEDGGRRTNLHFKAGNPS